jgi:hypothetical protein
MKRKPSLASTNPDIHWYKDAVMSLIRWTRRSCLVWLFKRMTIYLMGIVGLVTMPGRRNTTITSRKHSDQAAVGQCHEHQPRQDKIHCFHLPFLSPSFTTPAIIFIKHFHHFHHLDGLVLDIHQNGS